MAIDAHVAYVEIQEDGSGTLHLCDRVPDGSRGQSILHFVDAPHDVTCLNGLPVWGGAAQLMVGEIQIARREGYTRIVFDAEKMREAVADHHRRERERRLEGR